MIAFLSLIYPAKEVLIIKNVNELPFPNHIPKLARRRPSCLGHSVMLKHQPRFIRFLEKELNVEMHMMFGDAFDDMSLHWIPREPQFLQGFP